MPRPALDETVGVPLCATVVLGIDVSLTSTGLAQITADGCVAGVVPTSGHQRDPLTVTAARIEHIVTEVRPWLVPGALVVIEGPSYDSTGGKEWDRAGLWHRLVAEARSMGCPVAQVAPRTRAKWAAGHGGADKARVAVGLRRLLPDHRFVTSDDADAAVLALMGAQRIGLRPQTRERLAMLDAVEWPPTVDDYAAAVSAALTSVEPSR